MNRKPVLYRGGLEEFLGAARARTEMSRHVTKNALCGEDSKFKTTARINRVSFCNQDLLCNRDLLGKQAFQAMFVWSQHVHMNIQFS